MNLHVFSDLHFDARALSWEPKLAPGADVVVCAGDVCEGLPEAFAFLRSSFPASTPIVTVAGNHSFYRRRLPDAWGSSRAAVARYDIALLENEATVIDGVRFLGATLWTDYCLNGGRGARRQAMATALRQMNDHTMIRVSHGDGATIRFMPQHAAELHRQSVAAIDAMLAEPFDGPTVVVTHHAPHPNSIASAFHGDTLNPAFVSDLGWLIEKHQPDLWIHGHTHASADYRIGRTRVLCNPHGYGRENVSGFDPALVVRVDPSGENR